MNNKELEPLYIFGTSSTSKTIFTFVTNHKLFDVKGFIVDKGYKSHDTFLEHPIVELDLESSLIQTILKEKHCIFIAIQWNKLNADRRNVYCRLKEMGFTFANIISPNAVIHGDIIGDNCWISDFVLIEPNSVIGNNVFVKSKALVGPNSVIGNHCFIGANSSISGSCKIGDQSFIGINATVFDERTVGKKCIVGATTIVKRNLPDNSLVKTVSDNQVIKQYDEDEIENKLLFKKNVK